MEHSDDGIVICWLFIERTRWSRNTGKEECMGRRWCKRENEDNSHLLLYSETQNFFLLYFFLHFKPWKILILSVICIFTIGLTHITIFMEKRGKKTQGPEIIQILHLWMLHMLNSAETGQPTETTELIVHTLVQESQGLIRPTEDRAHQLCYSLCSVSVTLTRNKKHLFCFT